MFFDSSVRAIIYLQNLNYCLLKSKTLMIKKNLKLNVTSIEMKGNIVLVVTIIHHTNCDFRMTNVIIY